MVEVSIHNESLDSRIEQKSLDNPGCSLNINDRSNSLFSILDQEGEEGVRRISSTEAIDYLSTDGSFFDMR